MADQVQTIMTANSFPLQLISRSHEHAIYANVIEPRLFQQLYATAPYNFLYHIIFGTKSSMSVSFDEDDTSWLLKFYDPVKAKWETINMPIKYWAQISNVEIFTPTSVPVENILSFLTSSRISQSLDSTLTAFQMGTKIQLPNIISSPLMISDNASNKSIIPLALMVSAGFPKVGITSSFGDPTALIFATANVLDQILYDTRSVTSYASSNYSGDIESEEEEHEMRIRSFTLSYDYIPEYQKRFNGHPWKYFVPPSNHQLLQYSDSLSGDTNSYYESVELEKNPRRTRNLKKQHAGNQRGYSTDTESADGYETLSLESL